MYYFFFFFKQKTAYEMRISDWSSDVCSSDLHAEARTPAAHHPDAIDGAEGRRALSRLGHARWRPAGSMVADLLSAPPASSAEPAGSDRRALVPQRALPELDLATRGQADHPGARGALSVSDGGGAAGAGPYGHSRRSLDCGPADRTRTRLTP